MITNTEYKIISNKPAAKGVYELRLGGDAAAMRRPGQFVNIMIDGCYLRRPFSVADWDEQGILIYYKVVGEGTARLSAYKPGQTLNSLTGLGNGFETRDCQRPLLIGGGVGVPPLYALAKRFVEMNITPVALLGFATREDVFLADSFHSIGCKVDVTLETDGLRVTDRLDRYATARDTYFACGPEGMLRAIHARLEMPGQLSLETRMACGVGLCVGCTCRTKLGGRRVCTDGPVFGKDEIIWDK